MHFRDLWIVAQRLVQADKFKSIFTVFRYGQELTVLFADIFHKKSFSVAWFSDENKGHFFGGAAFRGIFNKVNEVVYFIIPADNMLFSFTEKHVIVYCF